MFKGRFKKSTVAVAAVFIALFTAAVVVAVLFFLGNRDNPSADGQAVVYRKSDGVYLKAAGESVKVALGDDTKTVITSDNKFFIYTTPSAKVSKKYDLYACPILRASDVRKGPVLLDYGVEQEFEYSADRLYYSKQDISTLAVTTYVHNFADNKKTDIDFAIENIYVPSTGETVFYTKNFVDSQALYSFSPQTGSRELMKPVADVHFYDDGERSELLFETGSYNEGEAELYSVAPGGNPIQIATMVSSVIYDDYVPGGNLYYFVKKETPSDWRGIIEDDMALGDESVKEPDKDDYIFIFGISIQYRLDMDNYRKKLNRDKIREALDEETYEGFFSEGYNLYVRKEQTTSRLAEGVEVDNVFSVASEGSPRAVLKRTEIVENVAKMSDISALIDNEGYEAALKFATGTIKDNVKKSGVLLACADNSSYIELPAYDNKTAEFMFTSGDILYVQTRGDSKDTFRVYKHTVSLAGVSQAEQIDSAVVSSRLLSDELWYQKNDSAITSGDLYRYYQDKAEREETGISSFSSHSADNIVIYKNFVSSGGDESADLFFWNGEKISEVSKNVVPSGLRQTVKGVAFIRTTGDDTGELCIYSENQLAVVDNGVYNIIAY